MINYYSIKCRRRGAHSLCAGILFRSHLCKTAYNNKHPNWILEIFIAHIENFDYICNDTLSINRK